MTDKITISKEELFAPQVDEGLARQRAMTQRPPPASVSVARWRRVLQSPLFFMPLAGLLGALIAWAIVEPYLYDASMVGGRVELVNTQPFDVEVGGGALITVGRTEVVLIPESSRTLGTQLEAGADGQPAFEHVRNIQKGDFVQAVGSPVGPGRIVANAVRPATRAAADATGEVLAQEWDWANLGLFPITTGLVVLLIFAFDGVTSRNWILMVERGLIGTTMAMMFSVLALVPTAPVIDLAFDALEKLEYASLRDLPAWAFIVLVACRSLAWALMGAAIGAGMNLVRSTRTQLANTTLGGALGGAIGGLFFDSTTRFFDSPSAFEGGEVSRLVGLLMVGAMVGLFMALSNRLARQAWLRVRTGPLAGKSFVLHRTPTTLGSAPRADIYLFKDPGVAPEHAILHRVGAHWEIEDEGSETGTQVAGNRVSRRRLRSGDQLVLGSTVLEFEERQASKQPSSRAALTA